jgi:hypothetical protein
MYTYACPCPLQNIRMLAGDISIDDSSCTSDSPKRTHYFGNWNVSLLTGEKVGRYPVGEHTVKRTRDSDFLI